MARTTEQKIKLLVLYDILCKHTDETHHLSTNELVELLTQKGIEVSRKAIPSDIELLNQFGYEVVSQKVGYKMEYYVLDRQFETAEALLFSDAVKASKLTEGHKARLIGKLGEVVGQPQAESIAQNLVFCDMPKRSNPNILYYIDLISRAITTEKKISFQYYSLDEHKQKVYRKEGKRYVVNPLVMVWNKDNYYLMTYHDRYDGFTNYRIDHMDNVEIEETPRTYREEYAHFQTEEYRKQVFSMFGGEAVPVEITFPAEMIDDIYDKFGETVTVERTENDRFKCVVTVQISKTFYGWVAGSCGKVRICSPSEAVKGFTDFVDEIKAAY